MTLPYPLFLFVGLLLASLVLLAVSSVPRATAAEHGIRFASFNASLNRSNAGDLITDLSTADNEQAQAVAEIIQRTAPDVLLINEFDYDENGQAADLFRENYLEVSQNGADPISYPYVYVAPSNTGIPSGFNLDNDPDGTTDGPNDAFGFGFFPGQFGMVIYSRYPIITDSVRTFQTFLWKDMPGALLPDDPDTAEPADWYSEAELEVVRLSSKSHWDVPIDVDGTTIHALVSHPTPPVFDGPEDRNGLRNHDEIRFWADYVAPGRGDYIYDDSGTTGGLEPGAPFVIMGDQNADPFDGDSTQDAILQLLDSPFVNTSRTPSSLGGIEQAAAQGQANATHEGNPAYDTADFSDGTPGNLRADYVLPSNNLGIADAGVFWPTSDDPLFDLVGTFPFPSSDHRLVWVDVLTENTLPGGVASGDVTQTSAVLWARSTVSGTLSFAYGTDSDLISDTLTVSAEVEDPTLPVKVEISDLTPGTTYYYRATDAAGTSAEGRFVTPAEVGTSTGLRFGVVGDWQEPPPYPSLVNVDEQALDFFVQHSDNIYADILTPGVPDAGNQARTLEQFRAKYAEVQSTLLNFNTMADLRAASSVLATIDDHELTDNFAGGAPPAQGSNSKADVFAEFVGDYDYTNDTPIYENALQAFQEYNPLRDEFYEDTGSDPRMDDERKLYRSRTYGSDAAVFITDPRSFRDAQIPPVASLTDTVSIQEFLVATFAPTRTMLGGRQLTQLQADLLQAEEDGITWKFVFISEPVQLFGPLNAEDRFEGYAAERAALLQFIDTNGIDNVVFVAADFHGTIVNNLTYQTAPGEPQIPINAFEIIVGPVAFYSGTFGPAVIDIATAVGLITPEQRALYESLTMPGKDQFVRDLIDAQVQPFGYTPVGLEDFALDVTPEDARYVAAHKYGWTEFEIGATTQALTVTTYGMPRYQYEEYVENPGSVLTQEPEVLSQFVVSPDVVSPPVVASPRRTDLVTPTLTGSAAAGVTITLTIDLGGGASVVYETTTDAEGAWSIEIGTDDPASGALPEGGLAPGTYPVTVVATDEEGDTSLATEFSLTIISDSPLYLPLIVR
jgi:phosphodiesterase/alkaline phosphatase D-like protein